MSVKKREKGIVSMNLKDYLFQWATEPDSTWDPQDAAVALTAAGFDGALPS
jgi:hypothetical protein